ncbi:MAG: hypothetical protein IH911_07855, partial [Proteobacteria bacterium]|nr:hypothetical protein [Pseudomonadota bacterium]
IKGVHDVVSATHQFSAKFCNALLVEIARQTEVNRGHPGIREDFVIRVIGGANDGDFDAGLVHADEGFRRWPISAFRDAK